MPPAPKKSTLDQRITDAGGPVPLTIMVVCGEMMRRSRHPSSARPEETERALSALSVEASVGALAATDVSSTKTELVRALADSFEAAFADDDGERAPYASSAMKALVARDKIASVLVAARARLDLAKSKNEGGADGLAGAIETLERAATALDADLRPRVRSLTGVNRERRAELAKLDVGQREGAWWYSARSDQGDDDLLLVLGGADNRTMGDDARGDLASSDLPHFDRAHDASALRRASLGVASPSEKAWLERRAQEDPSLREAVALASDASLEDGAD